MTISVNTVIKQIIHKAGWDLHRYSLLDNTYFQILQCLNEFSVNQIFDIGANIGQFADGMRSVGYCGKIVSFEPLTEAHRHLVHRSQNDALWRVHEPCAIGDMDGEIALNISGNSFSSSILPMLESHSDAAAGSAYVASERVKIARLDTIAPTYLVPGDRFLLKIDTQGYEWQVLDGASETLANTLGVLCELSIVPLYEDQRLWRDILDRLELLGFTLWALQKGFTDPRNGRSLQMDALFVRMSERNNLVVSEEAGRGLGSKQQY